MGGCKVAIFLVFSFCCCCRLLFVVSVGCRFQVVTYLQVDLSCLSGFVLPGNIVWSYSTWFPSLSVVLDCFR